MEGGQCRDLSAVVVYVYLLVYASCMWRNMNALTNVDAPWLMLGDDLDDDDDDDDYTSIAISNTYLQNEESEPHRRVPLPISALNASLQGSMPSIYPLNVP